MAQWHDAYQQGLQELSRGRVSRAAHVLEIAVRQQPQPGRNVSVGVVSCEMVAGRRPFAGDNPFAVLEGHATQPPEPPSRWEPDLPSRLEAIILHLLEMEPARRPPPPSGRWWSCATSSTAAEAPRSGGQAQVALGQRSSRALIAP